MFVKQIDLQTISLRSLFCVAKAEDFLIRAALQRNGLSQQRTELPIPGNTQVEAICHGVATSISGMGKRLEYITRKVPFHFQNVMTDRSRGQDNML